MTNTTQNRARMLRGVSAAVSPFHIELDKVARGMSLLVCGVLGISEFSEKFVALTVKGMTVKISGVNLSMTVYESKTVEIVGKIEGLEYEYTKA